MYRVVFFMLYGATLTALRCNIDWVIPDNVIESRQETKCEREAIEFVPMFSPMRERAVPKAS